MNALRLGLLVTFLITFTLASAGCGDDAGDGDGASDGGADMGGGGGATCAALCNDAGFNDGTFYDYDPVFECQCEGGSGTMTEALCDAYCVDYGVGGDDALLSGTDKCVCDGT